MYVSSQGRIVIGNLKKKLGCAVKAGANGANISANVACQHFMAQILMEKKMPQNLAPIPNKLKMLGNKC